MTNGPHRPAPDETSGSPPTAAPVEQFGDRVEVVLVRPIHAGNVGAVARAMKNTGLYRLTLVAPENRHSQWAEWMASGAQDLLRESREVASLDEVLEGVTLVLGTTARARRFRWPVYEPGPAAERILDHAGRVALLFGPEDTGLDNETLLRCHGLVTIPTAREPSLNLSQAVMVVAHQLFLAARARGYTPRSDRVRRSRRGHRSYEPQPANSPPRPGDHPAPVTLQERAVERAVEVLGRTAYLAGRSPDQVRLSLGGLLQRAGPSRREVEILLGMLAKVRYELGRRQTD